MNYLASALFVIGPLSVGVLLVLLASLGKRLGEALELPPYYRLYHVSLLFFVLPLPVGWILLLTRAWGIPEPALKTGLLLKVVVATVPLTIGITLAVFATAKYWRWIWEELGRSRDRGRRRDEA
mgnify:FL=1